jgi:chorismate-pyruvate lyase
MTPAPSLLYPLNEFYDEARVALPPVSRVEDHEIPEPCRSILAHNRDMTPTIEDTYKRGVELHVLKYWLRENVFSRQIVLKLQDDGTAVVFGAIKIYLEHFPPQARSLVIDMKQPLGTILRSEGIAHTSRPDGYFEVTSDALINSALCLAGAHRLYGRRNLLLDQAQRTLAKVVEILPPQRPDLIWA